MRLEDAFVAPTKIVRLLRLLVVLRQDPVREFIQPYSTLSNTVNRCVTVVRMFIHCFSRSILPTGEILPNCPTKFWVTRSQLSRPCHQFRDDVVAFLPFPGPFALAYPATWNNLSFRERWFYMVLWCRLRSVPQKDTMQSFTTFFELMFHTYLASHIRIYFCHVPWLKMLGTPPGVLPKGLLKSVAISSGHKTGSLLRLDAINVWLFHITLHPLCTFRGFLADVHFFGWLSLLTQIFFWMMPGFKFAELVVCFFRGWHIIKCLIQQVWPIGGNSNGFILVFEMMWSSVCFQKKHDLQIKISMVSYARLPGTNSWVSPSSPPTWWCWSVLSTGPWTPSPSADPVRPWKNQWPAALQVPADAVHPLCLGAGHSDSVVASCASVQFWKWQLLCLDVFA